MNTHPQKSPQQSYLFNGLMMLFAGLILAGTGYLMERYSNYLIQTDPVFGCTQVGCAPGLLGFAGLISYLGAILLAGMGYLHLISLVSHAGLAAFILLGGAALAYAILLFIRHFPLRAWGTIGLVFLFLNGLVSALRLFTERGKSRQKTAGK
jgi:hypothetical protein